MKNTGAILAFGLLCLAMMELAGGCGLRPQDLSGKSYPRIRFDLEIKDPDSKTPRYLELGVEASNLRYHEVDSAIREKKHFYLASSNGLARNKKGDRIRPYVIGEMHLVLSESLAERNELPCRLTMGNGIREWTYRELSFDSQGNEVPVFAAPVPVHGEIVLTKLSWIKGKRGFKDRLDLDDLAFYRFQGTLDVAFDSVAKEGAEERHVRQIIGTFDLSWRKEHRGGLTTRSRRRG